MAEPAPTRQQQLIDAAQIGAVAVGAQAVVTVPATAPTLPARAAAGVVGQAADAVWDATKIALVLRALRSFMTRKQAGDAHWLEQELRKRYPKASPAVIRSAVELEMRYEEIFQQKAMARVERDLLTAGQLPTPEARTRRVKAILNRERHYVRMREDAMYSRSVATVERSLLRIRSPLGAKWVLGDRNKHTEGCKALAGKVWPWEVLDIINPPVHVGCFPAGVEVAAPGHRAVMKRWYAGELVTLTFASGQQLPVTPNHPLLTDRGWVAAGLLEKGDHVVRCKAADGPVGIGGDRQYVPAPIEQVFTAASVMDGTMSRMPTSAVDFHGDGLDGEVDVVRPACDLGLGFVSTQRQQGAEVEVVLASGVPAEALDGEGSFGALRWRRLASTRSGIGGSGVGTALFGRETARPHLSSFTGVAEFDASLFESSSDRAAIDAEAAADALEALASDVALDDVVGVERNPEWSGYVHNIDSGRGWYIANGILVHNCGCGLLPVGPRDVVPQPGEAMRLARAAMALEEARGYEEALHPRDRTGRWITEISGFDHNPAAKRDVEHVVGILSSRYRVPLKQVKVDPVRDEIGQLAGKDKDSIYVSPKFVDDHFMANRQKDWQHVSVGVPDDPTGRRRTITHEYGHILDGALLQHDRKAYDELSAFLNEKGSYGMPGERTRLQAGLEAPSAYGTESRYEFVAEALADWIHNGESAHPSSQWIGKHFDKHLGIPEPKLVEPYLTLGLQESYEEILHPRGRGGKWIEKLGAARLKLKGGKRRMSEKQVHTAAEKVARGLVDFYGGGGEEFQVHHEPEYLATVGSDARFRGSDQAASGLLYGKRIVDNVRDPEMGVGELRIIAHEAAHSLSGTRPGPLPGFSQTFEEGGAEILSLWFWHHQGQRMDHRDAVRAGGKWTEGLDTLAHSVAYRDWVEETMRRAASKVGWDRHAIINEVERVMRGDHNVRLKFRDETDPKFPLPKDLPEMARGIADDRVDHAVPLVRWLVSAPSPISVDAGKKDRAQIGEQAAVQRLIDLYNRNPHREHDRAWYQQQHDLIQRVAKDNNVDPYVLTGMVAAISPKLKWEEKDGTLTNLNRALVALKIARTNPTDNPVRLAKEIDSPGMFRDALAKALRIYHGESLETAMGDGAKTRSFFNNLAFPEIPAGVTIDTHMARAVLDHLEKIDYDMAGNLVIGSNGYGWVADRANEAAHAVGVLPHELQAAVWVQVKREMG